MQKILILALGLFFAACAIKDNELYNLSADEWYHIIIKDLQIRDLEIADGHYNSMAAEHIADPLLERAQLILAQAHLDEDEFDLADFYLEENAKRFGTSKNMDFIRFLQIKAKFKTFAQPNRDQGLLLQGMNDIDEFSQNYPDNKYDPLVKTMLAKFNLAIYALDENIASLYRRTDRDESYEIYKEKLKNSDFNGVEFKKAKVSWYRRIFE